MHQFNPQCLSVKSDSEEKRIVEASDQKSKAEGKTAEESSGRRESGEMLESDAADRDHNLERSEGEEKEEEKIKSRHQLR